MKKKWNYFFIQIERTWLNWLSWEKKTRKKISQWEKACIWSWIRWTRRSFSIAVIIIAENATNVCFWCPKKYAIDYCTWGHRGRDCTVVGFTTTCMQSVPITTKVVSSNPVHGEVCSIQHYVIKFVSYLQQVGSFLCVLRIPPPIKLTSIMMI